MAPYMTSDTDEAGATHFVDTIEAVRSMVEALAALPTNPPELYIDLEGTNLSREGTLSIITIHVRSTQKTYIVDITTLKHLAFDTPSLIPAGNANASVNVTASPFAKPRLGLAAEVQGPATDLMKALNTQFAAATLESTPQDVGDKPPAKDGSAQGPTLRTILESRAVPKVFFDVRNDSDALFAHYRVSLSCVHDAQLMEVASRAYRRFVHGLARCISQDAGLWWRQAAAWQAVKDGGKLLFDQDRDDRTNGTAGGGVFDRRPMPGALQRYCVNDVVYLPRLRDRYWGLLSETWRRMVLEESAGRVRESQAGDYRPHGRQKAEAPAAWNF